MMWSEMMGSDSMELIFGFSNHKYNLFTTQHFETENVA
jgi:hypothetical protein